MVGRPVASAAAAAASSRRLLLRNVASQQASGAVSALAPAPSASTSAAFRSRLGSIWLSGPSSQLPGADAALASAAPGTTPAELSALRVTSALSCSSAGCVATGGGSGPQRNGLERLPSGHEAVQVVPTSSEIRAAAHAWGLPSPSAPPAAPAAPSQQQHWQARYHQHQRLLRLQQPQPPQDQFQGQQHVAAAVAAGAAAAASSAACRAASLGSRGSSGLPWALATDRREPSHGFLVSPTTTAATAAATSGSGSNSRSRGGPWGRSLMSASVSAAAAAAAVVASSGAATVSAKQLPQREPPREVVLYQYEACPFCNKVKAFLDYYGVAYRVVEVNPIGKKELKWSEYKKVPVLVVDGEPLCDSSAIITELHKRLNPQAASAATVAPKKVADSSTNGSVEEDEELDEESKWRKWVDNHLVHLLSPNIYRTPGEALEAFDYIATNGNFGMVERAMARYVGASTMYFIGKKLKKKHNIDDERKSLYAALDQWVDALHGRKFLGGEKPNLADLAVFGVLRPIRHMTTGRDMMEHTHVGEWYKRMEDEVGESARVKD